MSVSQEWLTTNPYLGKIGLSPLLEHEQKQFRDPRHDSITAFQLPYPCHIQPLHAHHQHKDKGTEVSIGMGYNKTKTRNHQSRTPYHQREPIRLC